MEAWRKVWRDGISDQLSLVGLEALRKALVEDDRRLIQGFTCQPQPDLVDMDEKITGADAICFAAWRGDDGMTVSIAENYHVQVYTESDLRLGNNSSTRQFIDWYDETPRNKMRVELLAEVQRSIIRKKRDGSNSTNA